MPTIFRVPDQGARAGVSVFREPQGLRFATHQALNAYLVKCLLASSPSTIYTAAMAVESSHTRLSPEMLTLIGAHLLPSDLAAFALVSRSFANGSDRFRFRTVQVKNTSELNTLYKATHARRRNVGRHVVELHVRTLCGPCIGGVLGEATSMHWTQESNDSTIMAQLCHILRSAKNATHLTLELGATMERLANSVLPSISSKRLQSFTLNMRSALPVSIVNQFLGSQPNLCHLSLPGQHQELPAEPPSIASGADIISPLRLSSNILASRLPRLQSVCAPASFILSLPLDSPLQDVTVTGLALPQSFHRPLFESLRLYSRKVKRLDVTLCEDDLGLGVMQEITRNLRDLVFLYIRGVARKAYYTYFLQDVTGCLSRCRNLKVLVFDSPKDPHRTTPATKGTAYSSIPSPDPSIPLPPLKGQTYTSFSARLSSPHCYPPNGPDLFRREQYYVNMYSVANPALRSVTLPAGTQWRWSQDVDSEPTPAKFVPFWQTPSLAKPNQIISTRSVASSPQLQQKFGFGTLPPIIIPNNAPSSNSNYSSLFYGWEPDRSCLEAREWWQESGLKPLSPLSDETEVESENELLSDEEDEPTDVEGGNEACENFGKFSESGRMVGIRVGYSIPSQPHFKDLSDAHLPAPPMILPSQGARVRRDVVPPPKPSRRKSDEEVEAML